ncbi:MAG: phage Gp37/Gp68 family protein [Bacilli bacterium]|nr:phage Gp37/Gp68 family protein [Bacilli bacterium]
MFNKKGVGVVNKTKIDWCDMSWNPVTGCLHDCEYCYAEKIAKRFGKHMEGKGIVELHYKRDNPYPYDFYPTFHKYRLGEPISKTKGVNIFVCSMADLFGEWVPSEWIRQVFETCVEAPQHRYLFLTKNPGRYIKVDSIARNLSNVWLGTTVTNEDDRYKAWYLLANTSKNTNKFLSIEPLLGEFDLDKYELLLKDYRNKATLGNYLDWVIVGAETGNRKDKVIPKKEWIMAIKEQCKASGVPLFMKESLRKLMGEDFIQEYPW